MATTKRQRFEPIVIEIDGKEIEICACGNTLNEDRTCDGTHKKLNAQMDEEEANGKTMTVEEVLEALNQSQSCCGGHSHAHKEDHACACGGNCGCNH